MAKINFSWFSGNFVYLCSRAQWPTRSSASQLAQCQECLWKLISMEDWRQLKWASSKLSKNVKELKPINSRDSKSPVTFWHGLASSLRRGLHKLTYNTIRVCPRSFLQIRETRRRVRTDSMCAVCRAVTITSRAKNKKKIPKTNVEKFDGGWGEELV